MNRDEKEMTMEYKTLSEVFDRFDDETRNHAANDLVSALLASCENHKQRIELSINLLGVRSTMIIIDHVNCHYGMGRLGRSEFYQNWLAWNATLCKRKNLRRYYGQCSYITID